MSPAETRILERATMGISPTPSDICATITSTAEMDGYEGALKARGGLTSDAVAAIAARRADLTKRGR